MKTELFEIRTYINVGIETMIVIMKNVVCEYTTGLWGTKIIVLNDFVAYPDSRAYKIEFVSPNSNTGLPKMRVIYLTPSLSYNYAYWVQQDNSLQLAIQLDLDAPEVTERNTYSEHDVVIASANSLPFYYPVENSYKVDGNVTSLALMTEQISEVQTGQWPVVIFTDSGIYSLEQGEGTVLYSRMIPISMATCRGIAVQTRKGVVYLSGNSINLLSGRQSTNLSESLEGELGLEIRECDSFALATQNDEELYNITEHLSSVDFKKYIEGAIIAYDNTPSKEEIIISNSGYSYSYVFSLITQFWHKITDVYTYTYNHYGLLVNDLKTNIVNMSSEMSDEAVVVHLQSRPLKFDFEGFKTIYRAIMRGAFSPKEDKAYGVYVFASNNLEDWAIVSAGQTGQNLSSIRLYRSRKSYKYFIVLAGGLVNTNTSLAYLSLEIDDKYNTKLR